MPTTSPVIEIRNDSYALDRVFSAISNHVTGIGTRRDKASTVRPNYSSLYLGDDVLRKVPRLAPVIRRAIELHPTSAYRAYFTIDTGEKEITHEAIAEYLYQIAGRERYWEAFSRAAMLARQFGDAFILLGINDNQSTSEPVDMSHISSIEWLTVVEKRELEPDLRGAPPEFYRLRRWTGGDGRDGGIWHESRVLRFSGNRILDRESLAENGGYNDSIVVGMFDAWLQWKQGIAAASTMLQDADQFGMGIEGLGRMLHKDAEDGTSKGEALVRRLLTLDRGRSVARMLAYDLSSEKPEYFSRRFSGTDAILDRLVNSLSMSVDIPVFKLFNKMGSTGLTSGIAAAMAYRNEWATCNNEWTELNFREPLERLVGYALAAKNSPTGGNIPSAWDIAFPLNLQLTTIESLELQKAAASRDRINIEMGVYSAKDAAKAYQKAVYDPSIHLNSAPTIAGRVPEDTPNLRTDDASPVKRRIEWQSFTIELQYLPFDLRHDRILSAGYGRFRKLKGSDGMALDVYVGTFLESPKIFLINQLHWDGTFDEEKIVVGVATIEEAKQIYLRSMPSELFGGIQEMSADELRSQFGAQVRNETQRVWGVWFEGRNTPYVCEANSRQHAISKAKKAKTTGHKERVVSCRQLKGSSLKKAQRGEWVRERANGNMKPSQSDPYKFRPQLRQDTDDDLLTDDEFDAIAEIDENEVLVVADAIVTEEEY